MGDRPKNVLITGASRRLGLFLCQAFLEQGDNVIAVTRAASDELMQLKCERLTLLSVASYQDAALLPLVQEIKRLFTRLDVLVHNASIFETDAQVEQELEEHYATLFNVHMAVPARLNLAFFFFFFFLHGLLSASDNGNIIHITDIYAENPKADHVLYCSTKAGLENLSKGFAKKFAPAIRVNSIQPGPIKFLDKHSDEHKSDVLSQTLVAEEGGFLPVYQAVRFLLDNRYVTGSSIKVDGGRSIGRG